MVLCELQKEWCHLQRLCPRQKTYCNKTRKSRKNQKSKCAKESIYALQEINNTQEEYQGGYSKNPYDGKVRIKELREFAEILNSIKISEGCDDKILQQEMLPISHAILQMMPNRLFRYRSCSDASVEAFVNDKVYAVTADLFNDPYDTLLRFDKDAIKQMFESLLSKDLSNGFRAALLQGIDFPDIVKQNFSKEYIAQTREYILSLAKEEDIETLILSRRKEINNIVDLLFPLLVNYDNKRTSTISCFIPSLTSISFIVFPSLSFISSVWKYEVTVAPVI